MQTIELLQLNEREIKFFPFIHKKIHRRPKPLATAGNQRIILTQEHWSRMVETSAMSDLVAHIDGGSLGNPGPSGIGVVIYGSSDGTIRIAKWIGRHDNNVAEYVALLEALQCALGLKAQTLHVFSDSEVVVRQMTGEYACRSP